ncbi:MAG TPA: ATP-binding protein [Frankiaceae bacterium]|nr:ATP-binding protein [Frankiaceae bacterium]
MATVELQFGALPLHVRTARLIAAAIARRVGVEESLMDEVKLAVGEACSRAVDVHAEHDPTQLVTVLFSDADDVFTISVLDAGPPLAQVADDDEGMRPSVGEMLSRVDADGGELDPAVRLPAGLGLALIEGLVDDVMITPRADGRGTRVQMSWPMVGALLLPEAAGGTGD